MSEKEITTETNAKWYCIQVFSGYEFKVEDGIRRNMKLNDLKDPIEVAIPVEDKVVTLSSGEKKVHKKSFMPGYMFVFAEINAGLLKVVQETNYVVGFVGTKKGVVPKPIPEYEMKPILRKIGTEVSIEKPQVNCSVGDNVVITDGPFKDFSGQVVQLDEGKVQVMVSVFGRITPVTLAPYQVERELASASTK